jgi:hypothetical protein
MLTLLPLSAASSVLPFPLSPLFFPVALSPFAIDVGHGKRCASCGVFHKEHHVVERTHPYITTSKLKFDIRPGNGCFRVGLPLVPLALSEPTNRTDGIWGPTDQSHVLISDSLTHNFGEQCKNDSLTHSTMADKITRIAIVDDNRCKPKRCAQECKKVRGRPPSHRSKI